MPRLNFDLEDGQEPVSFSLTPADADRFQAFMAECHGYLKRAERMEKLLATERKKCETLALHVEEIRLAWAFEDTGIHDDRGDHVRLPRSRYDAVNESIMRSPHATTLSHDKQVIVEALDNLIDSLIEVGGAITIAGIQGYRDEIAATEGTDG